MATGDTEICNRALQKIGAKRITSINEESVNARACKAVYDSRRKALLRAHRWSFAIKRASLAADATAPEWGRANAFTLPADYLKLIPTYPEYHDLNSDWVIEGRKIVTSDSAPLYVRYIADVTDTSQMDPLFKETLAADIAYEIAEEITQSATKKEQAKEDKKDSIKEAKKANAIEVPPADSAPGSWETAGNDG